MEFLTQLLGILQGYVITPLVWIFPVKWAVVPPGSVAVRYTFGVPSPPLYGPNTFFATSGQTLVKRHVEVDTLETENVNGFTEDGIPVRVSMMLQYSITDLNRFLTSTADTEGYMADCLEASTWRALSRVPLSDIIEDEREVGDLVLTDIRPRVEFHGVIVQYARLRDVEITDPVARALLAQKAVGGAMLSPTIQPVLQIEGKTNEVELE